MIPKTFLWNALINGKGKDVQQNVEWDEKYVSTYTFSGISVNDSTTNYSNMLTKAMNLISLPNNMKKIGSYLFYGHNSLKTLIIPQSVTSIGEKSFYGCTSLTDVYYTGSEEEWNAISIASGNSYLTNANIHYNYTT